VEHALREAQRTFAIVDAALTARRDPLDDRIVDNMLAGYAYVDRLVAAGIDVFAPGRHRHLLELNTLVLCGVSEARRSAHASHLVATERRFYEEHAAGVQDVVEWYARHRDESTWSVAAGVYVRILSTPQLFIEGNHRTGALVASYILLGDGQPPFVLSPANAAASLELSTAIRALHKGKLPALFRELLLRRRLVGLLRRHAEPHYLFGRRAISY